MRPLLIGVLLVISVYAASLWNTGPIPDVRPDLSLVLLVSVALQVKPAAAGGWGFATGLLEAAVVGRSPGAFMVSRTVAGFAASYVREVILRESVLVAVPVTCAVSLGAELVFFAMSPKTTIAAWAIRSLTVAAMNGVAAIPTYYVVRRILHKPGLTLPAR